MSDITINISNEIHYLQRRINILIATIRANGNIVQSKKPLNKQISALKIKNDYDRMLLDEHGCVLDVNDKWLQTMGYKRKEVVGAWIGDYLNPHDVDHFTRKVLFAGKVGEVEEIIMRMAHCDGSIIAVRVKPIIRFDDYGIYRQIQCEIEDITDMAGFDRTLKGRK